MPQTILDKRDDGFLFLCSLPKGSIYLSLNRSRFFVVALLALGAFLIIPAAFAQNRVFESLDDLNKADFYGNQPYIPRWLKDGNRYLEWRDNAGQSELMAVDARTGTVTPFYDPKKMETALAAAGMEAGGAAELSRQSDYDFDDSETRALLRRANDLYIYDFAANKAIKLTNSPQEAKREIGFSPDGKSAAFVREGNLYTVSADAPRKERQLTKDGGNGVLNGRLDWVYEEEVYGRGKTKGYAWSPDSRRIAFLRIDDRPVKPFSLLDSLPRLQNTEQEYYPKAGDLNPIVTLGIVAADSAATARFVDVAAYPDADRLIVRFSWHPDGKRLTFQVQNRIQNFLDLNVTDAVTGKTTRLFRETTPAWVDPIDDNPLWLKDGSFLWQSDRTGYRHFYRYKDDGTLLSAVTKGDWDVRYVYGADPKAEYVYFAGTERSWIQDNIYRVPLGGSAAIQRLTTTDAHHQADFSPTCAYFIDTSSDAWTPPQVRVRAGADGAEVQTLERNEDVLKRTAQWKLSKPEFLQIKARDGFLMEAKMLRPTDFDASKKYPIWIEIYGGPGFATIKNSWQPDARWPDARRPDAWRQFLTQHGYVVFQVDNRLCSGKGAKSAWPAYKKLYAGELADIEDVVAYLKTQSYVDGSRIGITGWSYGGSMVEYALTHSKSFKAGYAGAGVTDWHNYDSIYTERYMDTPQANPEGYKASSSTAAAADLTGQLLIVHGMMDDNVHFQNSVQFVYALQRAGKQNFAFMPYPSPASRHGIGDPRQSRHLRALEWKFIQENL